jgi:hypothetical protein
MSIKPIPATAALILWAIFPAMADAQASDVSSSMKFSCVVWKDLPYPVILYRQKDQFLPLTLPARQRSETYPLEGQAALELYILKDQPNGKPGHELVGKAALPKGSRIFLFMIQEAPDGAELPLRIFGMDDSLDAFPAGSFRFLNFTKLPLQVDLGGATDQLPPEAVKVARPAIPELGGFLPFVIRDAAGNTGFQTRLFGQPRGRKMVMIVPPVKQAEKLSVLFVPQIVPYPPEPDSP